MLHTKVQDHRTFGYAEDFKGFTIYSHMDIVAMFVM